MVQKVYKTCSTQEIATLRQRLFRILWSAFALEQTTIKILERLTMLRTLPEDEDVADLTDRLHETFNAYTFLTRSQAWHDIEDE